MLRNFFISGKPVHYFTPLIGTLLLVSFFASAQAVLYDFEEDFSDISLSNWVVWAEKVSFVGHESLEVDHTWDTSNGYLSSMGEYNQTHINYAGTNIDLSFGAWRLEASYPKNASDSIEGIFQIMLTDELYGISTQRIHSLSKVKGIKISANTWISQVRFEESMYGEKTIPMTEEIRSNGQWIQYDFIRTEEKFLVFFANQLVLDMEMEVEDFEFNYLNLLTNAGSGVKFDNVRITSDYNGVLEELGFSQEKDFPFISIGTIIATGSAAAFSFYYYRKKRVAKLIRIVANGQYPEISNSISKILKNRAELYPILLEQSHFRSSRRKDIKTGRIPHEMRKYKFLLHPFRLSIMKLLNDHYKLSSIEIKETLKLTWTEYSKSIAKLKKKGYVVTREEFDENSKRMFVYLQEPGRRAYKKLIKLFNQFLESTPDLTSPEFGKDKLYPQS